MTVEMIFVGTELLLGNIVNTNGQFLSEQCAALGLSVYYQSVVGDNEGRMREVISTALGRSDMVILCGGLGPTEDDLTKEICAQVMGIPLVEDEHVKEALEAFVRRIGLQMTDNVYKQAMVPQGAKPFDGTGDTQRETCWILPNSNGTAPGLVMEKNGKAAILLPGPPGEMKPMFMDSVRPYLMGKSGQTLTSALVKVCGVGESLAETMVLDLVDAQTNPTIATYAKNNEVHIRVTASAPGEKEGKKLLKPCVKELKRRFGDSVYTVKPEVTLEMAVVKLLKKHGLTMTTAESCTGGMVASRLVNVSGVSAFFSEGFVTYSDQAKHTLLGVKKGTLKKYTAVSEQTALEMAAGGAAANKSDLCVSVTGIAGPGGGTKEIPVGRVYIGCWLRGETTVKEYTFSGSREKIREYAASAALDLARRCMLNYFRK